MKPSILLKSAALIATIAIAAPTTHAQNVGQFTPYPDWWSPLDPLPSGHIQLVTLASAQLLPNAPGTQLLVDSETELSSGSVTPGYNAIIQYGYFNATAQDGSEYGCFSAPSGGPIIQCTITLPGPGTYTVTASVLGATNGHYYLAQNYRVVVVPN